jgi:hypothetical protein
LHQRRQILNKFTIAAVCTSEPVIDVIRRELKRLNSEVKIQTEQIQHVLINEVLKREVVEGEKADEARKKFSRAANKMLRSRSEREGITETATILAVTGAGPAIPSAQTPSDVPPPA